MSIWLQEIFQPKSQKQAFNASMGLRGWGASSVFVAHFTDQAEHYIPKGTTTYYVASFFEPIAYVSVNMFLLISGFLLYGAFIKNEQPVIPFIMRRLKRVYPTFLLVLGLYLALSLAFPAQSKLPDGTGDQILYVLANMLLLPGVFPIQPMITPTWSLSYEMVFYFSLPVFILLFGLRKRSLPVRIFLMLAVYLAIYLFAFSHYVGTMFIVGMLTWEVWNKTRHIPLPKYAGEFAIFMWVGCLFIYLMSLSGDLGFQFGGRINHFFIIAAYVPLVYCTSVPNNAAQRLFAFKPLSYVGNIGFSLYLIHGLCIHFFFMMLTKIYGHETWSNEFLYWLVLAAGYLFAVGASLVLYVNVERPVSIDGVGARDLFGTYKERKRAATQNNAV